MASRDGSSRSSATRAPGLLATPGKTFPEACVTVARFHGVQLFTAIETVEKHKEPILHRRASTHSNTRMETLNRIFKTARARTPSCPNVQTLHHHDLSDHHPNQRNIQIHLKRRGAL
jgi:hypothetical protein